MGKLKRKKDNKQFIRLSKSSNQPVQVPSLSMVTYPSNSKRNDFNCTTTNFSVGISGFKEFVIPFTLWHDHIATSIVCSSSNKKSVSTCTTCSDSKGNAKSPTPITLLHPTILRHKRNEFKDKIIASSPVKTLAFSPSKFLNRSGIEEKVKIEATSSKVYSSVSEFEDSGIAIPEIDFLPNSSDAPLTSTPSSKSRRKSFHQNIVESYISDDKVLNKTLISYIPESSEENYEFIPARQSTPQSPSPLKCSYINCTHEISKNIIDEKNHTAKARISESDLSSIPLLNKVEDLSTKQVLLYSSEEIMNAKTSFDIKPDASLRSVPSNNKFLYGCVDVKKPEHDKAFLFTDHWVSVACGKSYDQTVMTAAAKNCLDI